MICFTNQQFGLTLPPRRRQPDKNHTDAETLRVDRGLSQVLVAGEDDGSVDRTIGGERDEVENDQPVHALLAAGVDPPEAESDPRQGAHGDLIG